MARFFPTRTTCRFDTPGERRLAERLETTLENDYLCWFNVPVGPKAPTRAIDRTFQLYPQNSGINRQRAPAPGQDGLTEGSRLI